MGPLVLQSAEVEVIQPRRVQPCVKAGQYCSRRGQLAVFLALRCSPLVLLRWKAQYFFRKVVD